MNVIGKSLVIVRSSDPTKQGVQGTVVLETAKTLLLRSGSKTLRVEKRDSVFQLQGSGETVEGSRILGRLQDRWGRAD